MEVEQVQLPDGHFVRVPTAAETLRIKAFLIVRRHQVRDYLDVAALSDRIGIAASAAVLSDLDALYADRSASGEAVASQLLRQLGNPRPRDLSSLRDLARYKGLRAPWNEWPAVREQCVRLAAAMITAEPAAAEGQA